MRIVILGCGRLCACLARMLVAEGHRVTVIDRDSSSFIRLGSDFGGDTVVGVGIDEDVLREAGIEEADAFIAVTSWDNTNVMAVQVAKEIFQVPRTICRVYDPERDEIYRALGLETFCPTLWGAGRVQKLLAG
ncbi:MAG: TrkA family potassium uptake protein [Chloroflexota bacterium]|nr:TrkA family potassium uptake protein [Chloroflexota bacterium]